MPLFDADILQLAALLDQFFLPSRQLARAMFAEAAGAPSDRFRSAFRRPGAFLDPSGEAFDQTPIPGRAKRPRQVPLAIRTLLHPSFMVGPRTFGFHLP